MLNVLVDWSPFLSWFKCPFAVGILSGDVFRIRSAVDPGQKTKQFLLVAFINVFNVGEKYAASKYFAKYCAVLSLQRMPFMEWGEGVFFVAADYVGAFNYVLLFCMVIGISHKTLPERLILTCGIIFSFLKA